MGIVSFFELNANGLDVLVGEQRAPGVSQYQPVEPVSVVTSENVLTNGLGTEADLSATCFEELGQGPDYG